jgi:transcription initiation factor TFIID subunit 6
MCIFNLFFVSSCSFVRCPLLLSLQLYFDKITELTMSKSDSVLFKQALVSLATDSGLHPLVPYFTYFIADEVKTV